MGTNLKAPLFLAQAAAGMDCTTIYFNEQPIRRFYTDRATIIEWWLRQNNYDLEHSFSLQRKGPAKIGFLHRSLTPGTETFYLLAHLSEVLKSGAEVIIYLNGSADSPLSTLFEQYATRIVCLPADRRDEVLKRGARLDEATPGTGLGLSIVDELARAYGGAIALGDSALGGLRVQLTLPRPEV